MYFNEVNDIIDEDEKMLELRSELNLRPVDREVNMGNTTPIVWHYSLF